MNITEIKKSWPFKPIRTIEKFRGGVINDSYYIKTDRKDYVLRVYKRRSPEEIDFEINLLRHLKELPVPNLQNTHREDFLMIQNRPVIIYEYLEGEHVSNSEKEHRFEVGRFLGLMHKKGKNFSWSGKRAKLYDFPEEKIDLFIHTVPDDHPYRERFEEVLADIQEYMLSKHLPQGPIHVDVKPGNVLFSGKKLSGVIDFDNAYLGPLLLDLAKSMVWFGMCHKTFNLEFARDVWEGYEEIRSLEKVEQRDLYRAIRFAFASHLFVDFYMNAIKGIPKSYFRFLMNEFYPAYKSLPGEEAFKGYFEFYK